MTIAGGSRDRDRRDAWERGYEIGNAAGIMTMEEWSIQEGVIWTNTIMMLLPFISTPCTMLPNIPLEVLQLVLIHLNVGVSLKVKGGDTGGLDIISLYGRKSCLDQEENNSVLDRGRGQAT